MSTPERQAAAASLSRIVRSAFRLAAWWPGMVAIPIAYAAVAAGLYHDSYPDLWGFLAAAVVGVAWYASPLGRWEARRRSARPG